MDSLKEALEALTHKHFALAYLLLPDELMATQLLIDGVTRMMALAPNDLWGFKGHSKVDLEIQSNELNEVEADFVYHLIELGRIRQQHFASKRVEAIFKLSIDERVVLFLRDKRKYDIAFVAKVLNAREESILALTHKARAELLSKSNSSSVSQKSEANQFL